MTGPHTVWGCVADQVGAAYQAEVTQGPWGPWQHRTYISAPSTQYRRAQAHVDIRIDHAGDAIGQLADLSFWPDKQLVAIATVTVPPDVDPGDGSWYWSPTVWPGHRTGTIDMVECSLTQHPATVGLRPLSARAGDLAHRSARRAWTLPSNRVELMLERAADTAERDEPIVISTAPASAPPLTRAARAPQPPTVRRAAGTVPASATIPNINRADGLFVRPARIVSIS